MGLGAKRVLSASSKSGKVSASAATVLAALMEEEECFKQRVFLQTEERHLSRAINMSFHGGRGHGTWDVTEGPLVRGRARKWQLWGFTRACGLSVCGMEERRKGKGSTGIERGDKFSLFVVLFGL